MLRPKGVLVERFVIRGILLLGLFASLIGAAACLEEEGKYTPELKIVSHIMSHDEYGNSIVEGIAKNTGASEVAELEVRVKFYDTEGNLVDSSADYIQYVEPNETCKFCVHGLPADSYKTAISQTRSRQEGKYTPNLQIVSHSMSHDEYGNSIVEGIAKNSGASEVAELKIRVKFYDAESNLVDSSADYIEYIGANETCKFCVHGLPAENYKIAIFQTR